MEDIKPVQISIQKVVDFFDFSFEENPWGCEFFSIEDVKQAIADKSFCSLPVDNTETKEKHIRRIAFLVVNGWEDSIDLDLGVPHLGYFPIWPIQDGNHRFMAAIVRGDTSISSICSGEVDWINDFVDSHQDH